jgi:hypothetical protein
MLQYKCDDQGGPQPPVPHWDEKKDKEKEKKEEEKEEEKQKT